MVLCAEGCGAVGIDAWRNVENRQVHALKLLIEIYPGYRTP